MSKHEKELDRLTRELLAGTEAIPSSSFDTRLMATLMGERRRVYVYRMGRWFSPGGLLALAIVYTLVSLLCMWGGGFLGGIGGLSLVGKIPEEFYPLVLTVGAAIACFLLFTRLDDYWRVKEGV